MRNEQMKAGRFERWAGLRRTVATINAHLSKGGVVTVSNYMRSTQYGAKHADWFTCSKTSLYVRHGKGRVCIDGNAINFYTVRTTR